MSLKIISNNESNFIYWYFKRKNVEKNGCSFLKKKVHLKSSLKRKI